MCTGEWFHYLSSPFSLANRPEIFFFFLNSYCVLIFTVLLKTFDSETIFVSGFFLWEFNPPQRLTKPCYEKRQAICSTSFEMVLISDTRVFTILPLHPSRPPTRWRPSQRPSTTQSPIGTRTAAREGCAHSNTFRDRCLLVCDWGEG